MENSIFRQILPKSSRSRLIISKTLMSKLCLTSENLAIGKLLKIRQGKIINESDGPHYLIFFPGPRYCRADYSGICRQTRSSATSLEMVRQIIQYIRWKLRKAMGKTTLLYLSISEAFIPNSRSGGGPGGGGGGGAGAARPTNRIQSVQTR